MIDLHCHILPAVDDGAVDLDAALAICRLAADDGCTAMVATPHLRHELWHNDDRGHLEGLWRRLRDLASGIIDVYLGGEIAVNSGSCSEMHRLPGGDLLPLAGSRYLLLEFHTRGIGPDPEELIHELIVEGWCPVIAHPERIPWLASDPGYMTALLELGALAQVTAMSVINPAAHYSFDACSRMLDAGMVHFVASDAHDIRNRPPGLSQAYQHVARTLGEPVARELFITNPRAVLENRSLDLPSRPVAASDPEPGSPTALNDGGRRQKVSALLSRLR